MNNSHHRTPARLPRRMTGSPGDVPLPHVRPSFFPKDASITLAILAAVLLLPSLLYPFGRDQGVFAYVGSVILKGGAPYREVWEVKPPGIYYLYAVVLALTGHTMAGVRAFDLVAAVATALLLRTALQRFESREAAWLGALLSAALYLRLGFWGMAQTESYANLCTAAALAAWMAGTGVQALRKDPAKAGQNTKTRRGEGHEAAPDGGRTEPSRLSSRIRILRPLRVFVFCPGLSAPQITASLFAGAATAAALLLKVTSLPPLAAGLGMVSLLRARREGWRLEARCWALYLLGLLLPLALVAFLMVRSGTGAAYVEIQRGFVAGYVAMPVAAAAANGWRYFWHLYWLPACLAAGGLIVAAGSARLLLAAWLAAAFASVIMQRKYFGYHWTPVLLPLAGLAGVALARGLEYVTAWISATWLEKCRAPIVCAAGALLIGGWSVTRAANEYSASGRMLTGRLPLTRYWSRFGRPYHGDFSFLADRWAADYIRRHTRPADPVYIWGFEPLTLFLAGRFAPSRFAFAVPLVAPWAPPRWREELLRELRAHPPALFGVMRHDAIPWASGRTDDSTAQLEAFPSLRAFLGSHYRYETTIEDLTLYRRLPAAPLK